MRGASRRRWLPRRSVRSWSGLARTRFLVLERLVEFWDADRVDAQTLAPDGEPEPGWLTLLTGVLVEPTDEEIAEDEAAAPEGETLRRRARLDQRLSDLVRTAGDRLFPDAADPALERVWALPRVAIGGARVGGELRRDVLAVDRDSATVWLAVYAGADGDDWSGNNLTGFRLCRMPYTETRQRLIADLRGGYELQTWAEKGVGVEAAAVFAEADWSAASPPMLLSPFRIDSADDARALLTRAPQQWAQAEWFWLGSGWTDCARSNSHPPQARFRITCGCSPAQERCGVAPRQGGEAAGRRDRAGRQVPTARLGPGNRCMGFPRFDLTLPAGVDVAAILTEGDDHGLYAVWNTFHHTYILRETLTARPRRTGLRLRIRPRRRPRHPARDPGPPRAGLRDPGIGGRPAFDRGVSPGTVAASLTTPSRPDTPGIVGGRDLARPPRPATTRPHRVSVVVEGIKRLRTTAGERPDKAVPLLYDDLARIVTAIAEQASAGRVWKPKVYARRDIALLVWSYGGAFRESELCGLWIADIDHARDPDDRWLAIRLRGTKTTQTHSPTVTSHVAPSPRSCACGVSTRWLAVVAAYDAAGIDVGHTAGTQALQRLLRRPDHTPLR